MSIKNKFKNTALATILATTLTACGGGGSGGGPVGIVTNFVENDLTDLTDSIDLVDSFGDLLSDFNSQISSGVISGISAILTGPTTADINQANTLLGQLDTATALWTQTEQLISAQSDGDKYSIYNSESFKQAHAAMLYLKNHVRPVIQKVANGRSISKADFDIVAKEDKANEIIAQEKNSTSKISSSSAKFCFPFFSDLSFPV